MVRRRRPAPLIKYKNLINQPNEEKTVNNILMYVKTVGRPNNILNIWARKSCWVTSNDWVPRGHLNFIKIYKAWWLNVQSGHNKCKRIWVCASCAISSSAILKRY